MEINGPGEEHRALRLGVDPLSTGHGRPFEDAPQDGGRCQVRVEVILVRPDRAKVAEVDTVGDDPRHLCQVTADAIPGSGLGLGNPEPMRRQICGQRDGVGERRIGLREHDLLCGEEIRQLALEGPDGEVSFSRQYRDQGLPEVAGPRPDSARHAADREERLRLCRMVETAAEEDDVNTINGRVAGQRIQLRERTAEKIFPSDEVSAVFGNDDARGLIEGPIESVEFDLRNVDRWERIGTVAR